MKPLKKPSRAAVYLLGRRWQKRLTSNKLGAQFIAGLSYLLINMWDIRAQRGAILARPPHKISKAALEKAIRQLTSFGGWDWDQDDKVFISNYPWG